MIVFGRKTKITFTLGENGEPRAEIQSNEKNPDKISFGKVSDGYNKLEFASYDKDYKMSAFIFLNGERINIDKYLARKIMSLNARMCYFLGITKHKNKKVLHQKSQKEVK